jgi:hypothetical protein
MFHFAYLSFSDTTPSPHLHSLSDTIARYLHFVTPHPQHLVIHRHPISQASFPLPLRPISPVLRPAVCTTQRQFRSFIHSSRTMGDVVKFMPRSNLLSHRVTLESLLLAYLDLSASNYSRGTKSYLITELPTMTFNTAIFVNEVHSGHS